MCYNINMITVPQLVGEIVGNSPILSENFGEGLINYSSLARKLRPEIENKLFKKVTVGSIIMALKRLHPAHSAAGKQLTEVLGKITDLSMRSNLAALTFANSPTLYECQSGLLSAAAKTSNSFLTISQGIYETSIFISRNLLPEAEKIFQNETNKLRAEGLSSITLILPKEAIDTPGIHYSVFKKLFGSGVNVFDTVTSFTELTIFLRSEDTERAFAVLKKLS